MAVSRASSIGTGSGAGAERPQSVELVDHEVQEHTRVTDPDRAISSMRRGTTMGSKVKLAMMRFPLCTRIHKPGFVQEAEASRRDQLISSSILCPAPTLSTGGGDL